MKEITFTLDGQTITGQLDSKIDKKELYGYSKTIAQKDDVVLSRGYLCADGRLLTRQQISYARLDPEGSPVEEIVTEIDGKEVALLPSSFEQENVLEPAPLTALVGFNVSDVYPIAGLTLPLGLYYTEFAYRKSYQPRPAMLLVKADETYLLVGDFKKTTFVGLTVAYDFFDAEAEEDEGDELDFATI